MSRASRKVEKEILSGRAPLLRKFYNRQETPVVLSFAYDAYGDLFSATARTTETPLAHPAFFESLDAAFLTLPRERDIALSVTVRGAPCDSHTLTAFLGDNVRLHVLSLLEHQRRQARVCLALLLMGALLLLLSYGFGDLFVSPLPFDVVNILGSLLIWSGGEKLFFDQSREKLLRRKYVALLSGIRGVAET